MIFLLLKSPPELLRQVMNENPDLSPNKDMDSLKNLAYKKWIEQISNDYNVEINFQDIIGIFSQSFQINVLTLILESINTMTDLFILYKDFDKDEGKEKNQEGVKEEEKIENNSKIETE